MWHIIIYCSCRGVFGSFAIGRKGYTQLVGCVCDKSQYHDEVDQRRVQEECAAAAIRAAGIRCFAFIISGRINCKKRVVTILPFLHGRSNQ